MPDGIARRSLILPALEEAAQALIREDVPLALVPELRSALQGAAVRAVLDARVTMILHGHDSDADDLLPIGWLPMEARHLLERARALMSGAPRDLAQIRALLAESAAFAAAAIDRIDREVACGAPIHANRGEQAGES